LSRNNLWVIGSTSLVAIAHEESYKFILKPIHEAKIKNDYNNAAAVAEAAQKPEM